MRVVLDTNVLLSASFTPGACEVLLDMCLISDDVTVVLSENVYENQSRGECAAPNEQGKEGERGISPVDMLSEPDAAMRSSPPADACESLHTRSKGKPWAPDCTVALRPARAYNCARMIAP